MGSKERIARVKEETRLNILDAALDIVKEEGWNSLSMRKIAEKIEYTAPIIYEYFANKEGILLELTRKGYIILAGEVRAALKKHNDAAEQLEAMWIAYWNFAFKYKELYQLMYGVDMNCCELKKSMPESALVDDLIYEVIEKLIVVENRSEDFVCRKYYTFWSIIHGLISINLVNKGRNEEMNQRILKDAIKGIIKYIND
ncbi:TetR/AcrR family transcriptional regulator [Pedobacter psychroterrae]|uniref:TetR/AcrR family transcriptional regulator n=1 Tax=Pedobacter psychroterrae TaxID=2530453 RepID=A0A4R0NFM2_9SPHI|nr:TetR/AcrR family transcriptional regulator [Pedobacter psychroterrae]TCC97454.1 TetR/AcrR family transcriptional regulator [Pedobacter psychroterrae]